MLDYNTELFYRAIESENVDELNYLYSNVVEADNYMVSAISRMRTTKPLISMLLRSEELIRTLFLYDMWYRLRLGDMTDIPSDTIDEYVRRLLSTLGYLRREFIVDVYRTSHSRLGGDTIELLKTEYNRG